MIEIILYIYIFYLCFMTEKESCDIFGEAVTTTMEESDNDDDCS